MRREEDIIKDIKSVIERLRPYLQNDGGDMEFVRYEDGVVYIRMIGACSNCSLATFTLEDGVENFLVSEVSEVLKVVNLN